VEVFRRGLASRGWIGGRTVAFEMRNAGGDSSRYPELAGELVRLKVAAIYAIGAPAVRAAHSATRTIPIVGIDFTTDPVAAGYAKTHSRPGGSVTGVFLDAPEFSAKWLELLKGIVPGLSRIGILWDPSPGDRHLRALQGIAQSLGLELQVVEVHKPEDIDRAPSAFRGRPQAVIILPSPMIYLESARIAGVMMKARLPATSMARGFVDAGGLVTYGPENNEPQERGAMLVAKILAGAKPGDLPIERPANFELIVNLKAAKALNLKIPDSVLARADRIIR
jgi:putative ABC transport system substrate-binding protein